MIVIKGIRGAGKKSLMLKHLKFDFGLPPMHFISQLTIPYWRRQMIGINKNQS